MLYIIRHGQTAKNRRSALQGRSDDPLTATGERQSREAAAFLAGRGVKFGHVYTSPLSRAIRTAQIVAPGVPTTIDQRLIEMDYGPYEGMDLSDPAPEVIKFFSDFVHEPAPEGMEQLDHVVARAGELADELLDEASRTDVLLSTHAIAMKGVLEHLTPASHGAYWNEFVGNCWIFGAGVVDGAYEVPRVLWAPAVEGR